MFDDVSTHVKLQNAVSALVDRRLRRTQLIAWCHFTGAQGVITSQYFDHFSLQRCLYLTREWAKIDEGLSVCHTAVALLHVAFKTNRNQLTDEMLDILSTLCLQSNDVRRCLKARHSGVLSLGQTAKLMKVLANNSHSTVQLIEIELSKAYLYRTLRCKDSDSDSIYCLANVYLAVFTARQHSLLCRALY